MSYWWLSFADGPTFLGAGILRAESAKEAHLASFIFGVNPALRGRKCSVRMAPFNPQWLPIAVRLRLGEYMNRLLTMDELTREGFEPVSFLREEPS